MLQAAVPEESVSTGLAPADKLGRSTAEVAPGSEMDSGPEPELKVGTFAKQSALTQKLRSFLTTLVLCLEVHHLRDHQDPNVAPQRCGRLQDPVQCMWGQADSPEQSGPAPAHPGQHQALLPAQQHSPTLCRLGRQAWPLMNLDYLTGSPCSCAVLRLLCCQAPDARQSRPQRPGPPHQRAGQAQVY